LPGTCDKYNQAVEAFEQKLEQKLPEVKSKRALRCCSTMLRRAGRAMSATISQPWSVSSFCVAICRENSDF